MKSVIQLDAAIEHLIKVDVVLGSVIQTQPQPIIESHANYYEELVSSIIGQQLSVKAASTIRARFIALFGATVFPSPEQIQSKSIEDLRSVGLSGAKAQYVLDLAAHIDKGTIKFDTFKALTNEEVVSLLTEVKGIGEWTSHMFLMFCMGRLDVLPVGDLGIRNGITKLYNYDHLLSPKEVEHHAAKYRWAPYQTVASLYIWKSLDNTPK